MPKREFPAELMSALIGDIYDCALESDRWLSTIDRIRTALGFSYAVLGIYPLQAGEISLGVSTGIDALRLSQLTSLGTDIVELWGGDDRIRQFPLEEPILQSNAVSAAALASSRFVNEWAAPQGIVDAVAIGLERNARIVSTLSFGWHGDAGILGDVEIGGLRILAPHLRRAIAICQLLELRSIVASNSADVLNGLMAGVLVVDEFMSLIHANAAGEEMLARNDPARNRNGRVFINNGAATIENAVAQAARDGAIPGHGGGGFPVRSAQGMPYVVHLLPLKGRNDHPALPGRAAAALFFSPADGDIEIPGEAFASLYGLTPAELRIVELVVAGFSQQKIARHLGLKLSTVKTHLIHAFEKTGARRQLDLVRMAASLAGPFRH